MPSISIGVSSCLVGESVRYDGGHKLDRCITEVVARQFTLVPVCPEAGCGLPVPREAMRLEGDRAEPRLVTVETRVDLTVRMLDYCTEKLGELELLALSGFIFKARSPSCGVAAVPLYAGGCSKPSAMGMFAREVSRRFPLMPLAESEQLHDPGVLERFIGSVVQFHRTRMMSS